MVEMTPSELVSLKAKVKAEMLRRSHTGSLTAYGGTSWDFTIAPATGNTILAEHGKKVIEPLLAVKTYGDLKPVITGDIIPTSFDNTALTNIVNNLSAETTTTTSSSCAAACSGLCIGCTNCSSCTSCSGCNGCSSCSGTCDGCDGCSGGCTSCNGCTGGCSDGHCSSSCYGTCDGCSGCRGAQSSGLACSGYCSSTCSSSCGSCSGCSGSRHDV